MRRLGLIVLGLTVGTVVVFGAVFEHRFLWDDDSNIVENPGLNPVTLPKVIDFWQRPYGRLYVPLTYTVWAALAELSESVAGREANANLDPRAFHIANLTLHVVSVLIVFAILRLLVRNDWAAAGGALLFAVHPVQVEPVSWATGMKDLLCGFFSLFAIWQFLLYAKAGTSVTSAAGHSVATPVAEHKLYFFQTRVFHYSLASLAFVLALLAKPTAVSVPFAIWALDRWALGRSNKQSFVALAGWFAGALVFIVITKLAQPAEAAGVITPLWARPIVAGDAVVFYLYKLIWPLGLTPDYGRFPAWVLGQKWLYFAILIPLSIGTILWLWRERWPMLIASAAVFITGILPVSGVIPFDFQRISTVADRYLYLSMLGPALAIAWLLARQWHLVAGATAAVVLGALGIASATQTRYWRDAGTLFGYAVTVNPNSWLAHNNLGNSLAERGQLKPAIQHYRRALEIDPDYAMAHNNLGKALFARGELAPAIDHFRQALRINPDYAKAHYNLGTVLARQGEIDEATNYFRRAVEIDPNYAKAQYNLGIALARQGKLEEAIGHFQEALRTQPESAETHESLARALAQQGNRDEAMKHFQEALRLLQSRRVASAPGK
jgi:protein O-mannosyl-transferase